MREILFRGKTFNDEWVEGALVKWSKAHSIIRKYGSDTIGLYEYSVVPETVGQYIGLTDMNGEKIYEGDIVKYKEHILQVEYAEEYASYFFHNNGSVIGECTAKYTKEYAEIIGNIYDNPELLKVTK